MNRRMIWTAVWAALWLGLTVFIFANSLQGGQESGARSGWWAALLRPVLDPGLHLNDAAFHALVRKLAHMAEFGALAVSLGCAAHGLGALRGRRYICLPLLVALGTAVADECLQTFTDGRAGQVRDVLIDIAGALIGFSIVVIAVAIWRVIQRKREKVCEN